MFLLLSPRDVLSAASSLCFRCRFHYWRYHKFLPFQRAWQLLLARAGRDKGVSPVGPYFFSTSSALFTRSVGLAAATSMALKV